MKVDGEKVEDSRKSLGESYDDPGNVSFVRTFSICNVSITHSTNSKYGLQEAARATTTIRLCSGFEVKVFFCPGNRVFTQFLKTL